MKIILILVISAALFAISEANQFTDKTPCAGTEPRIRRSWTSLSKEQKKQIALTFYYMKLEKAVWCKANGKTTPLYDVFVYIHKSYETASYWHSTPYFLPAHRYFLYVYESCQRYIAWKYWAQIGLKQQTDACTMTLPYWDWTLDYDDNGYDTNCPVTSNNWSGIWDPDCFGSQKVVPPNWYVTDGIVVTKEWETVEPTGVFKHDPSDSNYKPYDRLLKRRLECLPVTKEDSYALTLGPSQCMQDIVARPNFADFSKYVEAAPHGNPHMLIGYTMMQMNSPDDPIFWLHHCNVERLYCVWQDCHGYEKVLPKDIKDAHYKNWVYRGPYGPDSQIPYKWETVETEVIAKINGAWPSPRQLWSLGQDGQGYDKLNVRYGPDELVKTYGNTCPDKTWTLVNQGATTKRDFEIHPRMAPVAEAFEAKLNEGKSHVVALREMAMEECENAPKNEIGPKLQEWMKMMGGLEPEQFDTICDKPSRRMNQVKGDEAENHESNLSSVSVVPLWGIIVASVGSALLLIAVISVVIVIAKRRYKEAENSGSYRQM